jgi:tetratricopeptide (TPR) repeat protein
MNLSQLVPDLQAQEMRLVEGDSAGALETLTRLAQDAEEYVAAQLHTTQDEQWFSFAHLYERLAYKRVEKDPRRLYDVEEPLDRLYACLAQAQVLEGDYDGAEASLAQAIRWNPMQCAYRLDLGELHRVRGDVKGWLGLCHSTFERASEAAHLQRAYQAFARFFMDTAQLDEAQAALAAALRFGKPTGALAAMVDEACARGIDPVALDDDTVNQRLGEAGLPEGANAEVAVVLLMCATDAAAVDDTATCQQLLYQAQGLIGAPACRALLALIQEEDAEAAAGEPAVAAAPASAKKNREVDAPAPKEDSHA